MHIVHSSCPRNIDWGFLNGTKLDWIFVVTIINVYLFLRERMSGGGAERGGLRIGSGLCVDSRKPDVGLVLKSPEIMT